MSIAVKNLGGNVRSGFRHERGHAPRQWTDSVGRGVFTKEPGPARTGRAGFEAGTCYINTDRWPVEAPLAA